MAVSALKQAPTCIPPRLYPYSTSRGVSETVAPPKSMVETLGGSDRFDRAMSAMQGAEQLREMESRAAKDQKRAEMEQRGLSREQIAAYLGEDGCCTTRTTRCLLAGIVYGGSTGVCWTRCFGGNADVVASIFGAFLDAGSRLLGRRHGGGDKSVRRGRLEEESRVRGAPPSVFACRP